MKTRDEFIKSIREKSEMAMAEKEAARAEKKIKQKIFGKKVSHHLNILVEL